MNTRPHIHEVQVAPAQNDSSWLRIKYGDHQVWVQMTKRTGWLRRTKPLGVEEGEIKLREAIHALIQDHDRASITEGNKQEMISRAIPKLRSSSNGGYVLQDDTWGSEQLKK